MNKRATVRPSPHALPVPASYPRLPPLLPFSSAPPSCSLSLIFPTFSFLATLSYVLSTLPVPRFPSPTSLSSSFPAFLFHTFHLFPHPLPYPSFFLPLFFPCSPLMPFPPCEPLSSPCFFALLPLPSPSAISSSLPSSPFPHSLNPHILSPDSSPLFPPLHLSPSALQQYPNQ